MNGPEQKQPSNIDKFFEVVLNEDVIEAILKNLTGFFAAATIARIIPLAMPAKEFLFVLLAGIAFIAIVFLNLMYGVKKILIPIDIALGAHLSIIKDLNKLPGQTDNKRLRRVFSFLFKTKAGWIYLITSYLFIWFVFTAMGLLANTK